MSSVQVKDILCSIRRFYASLAEAFEDALPEATGEQIPFLLEYIAHHEKQLQDFCEDLEEESDPGVLNTWLQFGAEESLDQILAGLDLHAGMDEDEILGEALKVDSKLVARYEQLAGESSVLHVQDLFEDLARLQEARERQLARVIR